MNTYLVPSVVATHPRGERIMDVYSHLLSERIVYLGTALDAGVANALIAQLLHLEADSRGREISLYINCEGGDPSAMLAVHDTMRYVQSPVATTCVGQAVAVGAVLLAGDHLARRLLESALDLGEVRRRDPRATCRLDERLLANMLRAIRGRPVPPSRSAQGRTGPEDDAIRE